MPSTRPRLVFDKSNVCNACHNAVDKSNIDWEAREKEFYQLIEENRSKIGSYDCIVPWSGGKDSSMIAYRLKFDFGLNPLLVTFSPMLPTEVGVHNREEILKAGFDHLIIRPNQHVAQHLSKRFFLERGNPKVGWDAGVTATPMLIAAKMDIPLIFYAEHGESEYGGHVLSEEHKKQRDMAEFLEHLVGDDPQNWLDDIVEERDLAPYVYPDLNLIADKKVKAMYFSYFFKWDIYENYKFISEKIDFKTAPNGRTDCTFTNYDSLDDKIDNLYYHMQYIKFGFGRSLRDASRLIQLGYLSREEGLKHVRNYDHEFPNTYLDDVLEFLELSKNELIEIIDKHRNPEIWQQIDGRWNLRFKIN